MALLKNIHNFQTHYGRYRHTAKKLLEFTVQGTTSVYITQQALV